MTSASAPSTVLTGIGSTVSKGATVVSVGVLAYEGYQFSQGQMDGGRFGYHLGSFGAAVGTGAVFGGPAGAAVGLGAKTGEIAYDTSKQAVMTLNGQYHNFISSMINAIMRTR